MCTANSSALNACRRDRMTSTSDPECGLRVGRKISFPVVARVGGPVRRIDGSADWRAASIRCTGQWLCNSLLIPD
jgi:hypothetical protein